MIAWECVGSVRGRCGIHHRTEEAAQRHCEADTRAVRAGHGRDAYSDRHPVQVSASGTDVGRLREEMADLRERRLTAIAEADALAVELRNLVRQGRADGLTPTELATLAGVSRETIYQWL